MLTDEFDYCLPDNLIAQEASGKRDESRLLFVDNDKYNDLIFKNFVDLLDTKDLIVFNETKVFPARLFGKKASGGKVEVLLINKTENDNTWLAFVKGRVRVGTNILFEDSEASCMVEECREKGDRLIRFENCNSVFDLCDKTGHIPLPPYIDREDTEDDKVRYQSVFAKNVGSVAAPTASLHFSDELMKKIKDKNIKQAFVTLQVGPGTFKPVATEKIEDYDIHHEWCSCEQETVDAINECKKNGGRVIAIGTTVVRTLESAYRHSGNDKLQPYEGWTNLFMYPPQKPAVVDALLTNFHLPKSSLLMLVSCFTGIEKLQNIYKHAIEKEYRFYSYGDAMFITER